MNAYKDLLESLIGMLSNEMSLIKHTIEIIDEQLGQVEDLLMYLQDKK